MSAFRTNLPQLDAGVLLTDAGIETTLIFDDGLDLPEFAAFVLLRDERGREALRRYFETHAGVAARHGVGTVLETATWRANTDWGDQLGYSRADLAEANREAVELLVDVRRRVESPATPVVISGCVGPRGDGYVVDRLMSADEAAEYHRFQAEVFAGTDADLLTAITMTYADEAIGVAEAAKSVGLPAVISFTVETDGRLPSGQPLGEAIEAVDAATGSYPAYYMINCAHPTHFAHVFEGAPAWASRLGGLRANASKLSHEELDAAEELDRGDPAELAARYQELLAMVPSLRVLGGCCGTDHTHIDAIGATCVAARA